MWKKCCRHPYTHFHFDNLFSARSIEIRFGLTHKDYFEQRIYAIAVARNPDADIAVVKLVSNVKETKLVKPALLPRYVERNEQYANRMAIVSGFGIDQSGNPSSTLKFVDLKIISQSACVPYFGVIDKGVLCAKSTNSLASTCPGDSGSSLALKEEGPPVVVGVVSYGHAIGCDKGN